MTLKRLFKYDEDKSGLRSLPMIAHFIFFGASSAILKLISPYILPALEAFNEGPLFQLQSVFAVLLAVFLLIFFIVGLASLKALIDWLLDG